MKIQFSLLALVAMLAPAQAAPHLIGSVRGQGARETSYLWLGGAYFPGKGWRTDIQSKGALHAGTRWQLFGLDGPAQSVTSGEVLPPDVPIGIVAQLRQPLPETGPMIAVANVGPSAQPRLPRAQNLNQPLYQKAAANLLRAQGLKIQNARLTQLLRVDLNGDGVKEVLMAASSRDDYGHTSQQKAGDYMLLALRYVDGGKIKTVALDLEYSLKNVGFGAPGYANILSCVDVDGDGKMEIIVGTGYYEGDGFEVWQFDGRGVKRVVEAGWGV